MNLLFNYDFKKEEEFDVILLINAVTESKISSFVNTISSKGNWSEELCCCYFEKNGNNECYRFETFEGNSFRINYNKFVDYVSLAIIRYLLGCKVEENIVLFKKSIRNTIFVSALNDIDESLSTGVPLVYE